VKLYCHPVSTTSRPLMLFIAESKIPVDIEVVDLMAGANYQPPFAGINPSSLVPVLEDGAFRLTESSAILKYLAETTSSPMYPTDVQQRARINERMDWFNTQLGRDLVHTFVYPQIFPTHKRTTDHAQSATLAWGRERAERWLKVLDEHFLGTNPYVAGATMSIADYFGAVFVAVGEVTGTRYSRYRNVRRWLDRMQDLASWRQVNEAIDGYGTYLKATATELHALD